MIKTDFKRKKKSQAKETKKIKEKLPLNIKQIFLLTNSWLQS